MSNTLGLISELDVVNNVLSVAGDNPVQSLEETYQPVFIIRKMISDASRDMQMKNYWFNTEYDVLLEPNTLTNKIILPFNILNFEPVDTRYVARGTTVYDREARTSTITEAITADISVMLDFDELPQQARSYIQAVCRRRYNNEYFNEQSIKEDLNIEVRDAKISLDKTHMENEDINIFRANQVSNIAYKNRRRS